MAYKIIDGVFEGDRFLMTAINGFPVHDYYRADGLRNYARLLDDTTPTTFKLDGNRLIHIPVEMNRQLAKELFEIADALD